MTDSRIRCLTVFTIAFGIAMLASNQAIAETPLENKTRINAADEKAGAAAMKAEQNKQKDLSKTENRPAKEGQETGAKRKRRHWHIGDPPTSDDFGGGFVLKKNYNPDAPTRAAEGNDQAPAEGTYEYLRQQVLELKRGQRPGGFSKPAVEKRQRAVDNLKALGPAASAAVPALIWSAMNERDIYVKRKAIEVLGEVGGMEGVVVVGWMLLEPGKDSDSDLETTQAAVDSLLKLLPAVGSSLTMNDAIFLMELHGLNNERLSPAIESAWAAGGLSQDAIAKELSRRDAVRQALVDKAIAKAKGFADTGKKWQVFYAALPRDWQARLDQTFADAKAHGATEEAERKFKEHFMTLPPSWQKWYMTPTSRSPDFGETLRKVNDFDRRVAAERKLEETSRKNAGGR